MTQLLEKRLLGGKLEMLNLLYQLRHKVHLISKTELDFGGFRQN
jgi:hypothetical protein